MFIAKAGVPVTDGENTIYIREKMNVEIKGKVMSQALSSQMTGGDMSVSMDIGAWTLAILVNNILNWDGPAFEGVRCTPANIGMLDPDEPLVLKVLAEIDRRNPAPKSEAEEKKSTIAGAPSLTAG